MSSELLPLTSQQTADIELRKHQATPEWIAAYAPAHIPWESLKLADIGDSLKLAVADSKIAS